MAPSLASDRNSDDDIDANEAEVNHNTHRNTRQTQAESASQANTHTSSERAASTQASHADIRPRLPSRRTLDERSGLLDDFDGSRSGYRTLPASAPGTPIPRYLNRKRSYANSFRARSRRGSFGRNLISALGQHDAHADDNEPLRDDPNAASKPSLYQDDRVWYDQFTSTDWVHDSIADAFRVKELRSREDFRGRVQAFFDGAQGWILVAVIGCLTAAFAYVIDVSEAAIFDLKSGYCTRHWWYSKRRCCEGASTCDAWVRWSSLVGVGTERKLWVDFAVFVAWVVVLALLSCVVTLQTKTTISSAISLSTLDENLGADLVNARSKSAHEGAISPTRRFREAARRPPVVYYPAAGSGVAEVRVILSGFVLHGYMGARTLVCKTLGLILSVASGLSIGKEGPYVHIATCIGNIATRFSRKYSLNDGKRREVLSAAAASGVAVAFGAPIGGVLFSLEEVSYYFPPKTLFRTFFCCIAAALSLKFLNPYGTGKIVLFEVRYILDWKVFEVFAFAALGILGGALGALFIKASRLWATTFRRIPAIKKYPLLEVFIVAVITGSISFWNRYTRLPVAELLYELAAPCDAFSSSGSGLCPTREAIPEVIWQLFVAFVVKAFLTTVSFGIKVPAGIYVPSMVVGGLLGRIIGHVVQLIIMKYPDAGLFTHCPKNESPESCVVPGVYALVAAGATMTGVTRLSVTLAVILFELTGSLDHVLPFSLGVLIAKWTADALEPLSIYDLLTDMNAYPYLDHKVRPIFTTELGDLVPDCEEHQFIDISDSPIVPAEQLREKLELMHMAGELDGGLPIVREEVLVGLIQAPDLEFALDRLERREGVGCLMSPHERWVGAPVSSFTDADDAHDGDHVEGASPSRQPLNTGTGSENPTDFTPYIDPAPVSLDLCSPMDLVYECFVKLGLRYICVLREGKFVGMLHKKTFVRFVKEEERRGRRVGRG